MHTSKTIVWIIAGIACLVVVLLAFRAGVIVGYRQAEYSEEWQHFHGPLMPPPFLNDHGAVGIITAVGAVSATTTVTIHDAHDGVDKVVLVPASVLASGNATATLKVGQAIAVIGMPTAQGEIVASIIHVLPQ